MVKLIVNTVVLFTNVVILFLNFLYIQYLKEFQIIYFENWFVDYYIIFLLIISASVFLFFYFSKVWIFLNISFLFINILLFMMCVLLDCMHDEAVVPELLIIPSIGLAIVKTKWTEEQLQRFFEEFQKEIEHFFTSAEKESLTKMATNPAELKEMMLQMDAEAPYELVIRLNEVLEFLPWFVVTLIFGMTSGYCLNEYIIKPWALGTNVVESTVGSFPEVFEVVKKIVEYFVG